LAGGRSGLKRRPAADSFRDGQTVFLQARNVEADGVADFNLGLLDLKLGGYWRIFGYR
jgi:hypothetical protein